ncbi:MAG: D-beta-D-heptose 7-phosphate kinase / D-beta-D-heptose 1-phosphate adenosyltransferase [Pseudonocardiales bacterium]|nr:D-beta-D-heptose 7-phosphate kinase / D-beta-D-heptose 1-phosphate adenosyltransferase [Pseudonocardiales bacterium]
MTGSLVVVGDVLLDVDILADAHRLTPDAPVPVLDEVTRQARPGGAALAALLAARDPRLDVVLVAPLADDDAGRRVRELLDGRVEVIALPCTGRTPVKTRLRAGGQTVARLDNGGGITVADVPAEARAALRGASGVLVSDYGGGTTADAAVRAALSECVGRVASVWDPHPRGAEPVPGVALVTPNAAEAAAAGGGGPNMIGRSAAVAGAHEAAETLLRQWRCRSIVVTLGARGALLCFGSGSSEIFPAAAASAGDTCGAGDCFAACAAIELATGALPSEAVARAVTAATTFVCGGGVGALADGPGHSPSSPQPVADVIARVRARGGIVVATGGCFDLLHAGHIETLSAARSLGDCLIVCLNSDASVRRLKGEGRPLQPEPDRAKVLAALRDVDAVVVFEDDTPEGLLSQLRPDIWVKGGDYAGDLLPETALVKQWGGVVVTVGYVGGRSTSELLALARQ